VYAKERKLIEDIREELRQGRRCQVYATFTGEHDVAARLERVLRQAGLRVAVLRPTVPTLKRELWYEKQLKDGVEVVVCHPKLVETGLDLLAFPTLYFLQDRVFAPHAATGLAPIVAHRTEASGEGKVLRLQGHDTDHVSPVDGEEDAGGSHDGGQVLGRRNSFSRE
jgi:hypothetical protein